MNKKFSLIDLFSGAGGMTLGFMGKPPYDHFQSVLAIDNDLSAVDTYNVNFSTGSEHCVHADIEKWVKENDVPPADIVIGGPPCQGFSLLNKNREGDKRRKLWEPYLEIVIRSGASIFIMENVQGLLKSSEYEDICLAANKSGFRMIDAQVLNTANYGVPQTRRRAIAIGLKASDFDNNYTPEFPPKPTHSQNADSGLPRWRTVRDFIDDLPRRTKGVEIRTSEKSPLDLHFGRNPTEKSKQRYLAIPPGGNRFDLQRKRPDITPNCWLNKPSGGTDLFGRLWWDRPSVTIRTEFFKPEKGRYLHPTANRPITHREAARLMSFPDTFKFCGTKIQIARQIGNAVPPLFAEKIAELASTILSNRKKTSDRKAA